MIEALSYTFMQHALIAGILVAITCALVGVFVVLRRLSPIGDGLAHIGFGAIAIGIVAGIYPLGVALVLCCLAVLGIQYLQRKGVYGEVGVSVFYAAGLASGIVILSKSQHITVDLFSYLFGSILSVSTTDLVVLTILTILVSVFILALRRQLFAICFDQDGAQVMGIRTNIIMTTFSLLLAITVVVGMKVAGTLLVPAMIVIPAASGIRIARNTIQSIIAALCVAIVSVIAGIFVSYYIDASTAGCIILAQVACFLILLPFRK